MTPGPPPRDAKPAPDLDPAERRAEQQAEEQRRRALRAKVFGEVLPESTGDDRDLESGEGDNEAWLRRNVPPHHG